MNVIMRIRTKHWARPELNASNFYIDNPVEQKSKWKDVFSNSKPIHLDLGCGKCTFLAEMAYAHKEVNFVAVDISLDILGVARRNISAKYDKEEVANIALTSYNIEKITDFIDFEDGIERIHINFCNPWPSARCHKRRLTHTRQLESYKKILKEDGEIWFKTDNDDLYLATKRYMKEAGFEIFFDTQNLALESVENYRSEHEVKFEAEGINTKALRARQIKLKAND